MLNGLLGEVREMLSAELSREKRTAVEKQQRKNLIQEKSFCFAVQIVKSVRTLQVEQKEFMSRSNCYDLGLPSERMLRRQSADRRKDFAAKMSISAERHGKPITGSGCSDESG